MKIGSDCSGPCILCACSGGCLAGHGDDDYVPISLALAEKMLETKKRRYGNQPISEQELKMLIKYVSDRKNN